MPLRSTYVLRVSTQETEIFGLTPVNFSHFAEAKANDILFESPNA